jgi:hypothetical protein
LLPSPSLPAELFGGTFIPCPSGFCHWPLGCLIPGSPCYPLRLVWPLELSPVLVLFGQVMCACLRSAGTDVSVTLRTLNRAGVQGLIRQVFSDFALTLKVAVHTASTQVRPPAVLLVWGSRQSSHGLCRCSAV